MDITPEIITLFRTNYPEYSDDTAWPDAIVTQALCEGDAETGGCGWGAYDTPCQNFKQRGMFLYAAHWLFKRYPNGAETASAVNPNSSFAANSKSVGDESVSLDSGSNDISFGDAWLKSSAYGQQFLMLRKRAGMGAKAV